MVGRTLKSSSPLTKMVWEVFKELKLWIRELTKSGVMVEGGLAAIWWA